VGACLIIVGVGLFGTLTAFLASRFVQVEETRIEHELSEIRTQLERLNRRLDRRED
jgi:CHASE1-domain containing sensor protein